MSEYNQLKRRIDKSGFNGVKTAQIRDDYKPTGAMMIRSLTDSEEYVQRRVPFQEINSTWKIFNRDNKPY